MEELQDCRRVKHLFLFFDVVRLRFWATQTVTQIVCVCLVTLSLSFFLANGSWSRTADAKKKNCPWWFEVKDFSEENNFRAHTINQPVWFNASSLQTVVFSLFCEAQPSQHHIFAQSVFRVSLRLSLDYLLTKEKKQLWRGRIKALIITGEPGSSWWKWNGLEKGDWNI